MPITARPPSLSCPPISLLTLLGLLIVLSGRVSAQPICVEGTGFRTADGRPLWLNGINTAWIAWNDFGGGRFDEARWRAEFARYAAEGINCARIWIDCNGEVAVAFDRHGEVTGPSDTFFRDLDRLFALAAEHRIYVLAVLTSFDHVKPDHPKHRLWRALMNNDARVAGYTRNFVEPLARRYANQPYLFAWEICNEPEWIWTRFWGVSRDRVIAFHGHVAAAIKRVAPTLVTTGSASWRWHRDGQGFFGLRGHPWSDSSLQAASGQSGARFDFYQVHYYDWMQPLGYSPYDRGATPARFLKTVDRPVIIGETLGRYSRAAGLSVTQMYQKGAANGYAGVFGWSARGHDGQGVFAEIAAAARTMGSALLALDVLDRAASAAVAASEDDEDDPVEVTAVIAETEPTPTG
ncbi:MAG TPA: cellulase family glycosylhydrolase [Opitutaceae bacterium]